MRVQRALEALDRGCCLEIYYDRYSVIVEPHTIGFDRAERPALLGVERRAQSEGPLGQWLFLHLDTARKIDISGYFSEAPRPGFRPDDPRFERILAQVRSAEVLS